MQIFTRLMASGFKSLTGALALALLLGVLGGGIVLAVAYFNEHNQHWSSIVLTYVMAGVIAVLTAYATATTAILRSIARDAGAAAHVALADVEKVAA